MVLKVETAHKTNLGIVWWWCGAVSPDVQNGNCNKNKFRITHLDEIQHVNVTS